MQNSLNTKFTEQYKWIVGSEQIGIQIINFHLENSLTFLR